MAAVLPLLLVSLPVVQVAGGAAFAALGVAAGVAGGRWFMPASEDPSGSRHLRSRSRRASRDRRQLDRPVRCGAVERSWGHCALVPADGCDVAHCEAFLAAVERWPLHVWLSVGRAVDATTAARRDTDVARDARDALDALVIARGHRFTAWLVHDFVETAAATAHDPATATPGRAWPLPMTSGDARVLAAARRAVARAAIARLLRPWLSAEHYAALTAPASVLPLTSVIPTPPIRRER